MKKLFRVVLWRKRDENTWDKQEEHFTASHIKKVIDAIAIELQDENVNVSAIIEVGTLSKDLD